MFCITLKCISTSFHVSAGPICLVVLCRAAARARPKVSTTRQFVPIGVETTRLTHSGLSAQTWWVLDSVLV